MEEVKAPVEREDLETPDDATVILTLARLHKNKAIDIVLDALKDLPNVYLWAAGEGPERSVLEERARQNGVEERVRFLGWRTDRAALLQACDICVFASRYEPFGTVFVQAWQQNTPVIVSDADGPSQFCTHEENCLMIPKNDPKALVEAIQRLKNDTTLKEKIVVMGAEKYRAEFTKEKSVQAYLEYYIQCLKAEEIID